MSLRDNARQATEYQNDLDSIASHVGELLIFDLSEVTTKDFETTYGKAENVPVVANVLAVDEKGQMTHISGEEGSAIFQQVIGRAVMAAHEEWKAKGDEEGNSPYLVGTLGQRGRAYVFMEPTDKQWKDAEKAVQHYESF